MPNPIVATMKTKNGTRNGAMKRYADQFIRSPFHFARCSRTYHRSRTIGEGDVPSATLPTIRSLSRIAASYLAAKSCCHCFASAAIALSILVCFAHTGSIVFVMKPLPV